MEIDFVEKLLRWSLRYELGGLGIKIGKKCTIGNIGYRKLPIFFYVPFYFEHNTNF